MFTSTWGNDPVWPLFFNWVETTNFEKSCGWRICLVDATGHEILFSKRHGNHGLLYDCYYRWTVLVIFGKDDDPKIWWKMMNLFFF